MDKALFDRIISLIIPHVAGDANRHALNEGALFGCLVLHQIEWSGAAQSFAVRLVQTLDRFGQCSDDLAVILLLRGLREQVGMEKQSEIDAVIAALNAHPGGTLMIDQAAAIGFLIEIGRWAKNELSERWQLRRKQQTVDLTSKEQTEQVLPILLKAAGAEKSDLEVRRTLDLIHRKRDAIYRAQQAKLADREQLDRGEITQAMFEFRLDKHTATIRDMLGEIEGDLGSLGISVEREPSK